MEQNEDFVSKYFRCRFCGAYDDYPEYTLIISGHYGSDHDMETVEVDICGECLEKMLAAVIRE